jgi:hypothetical protein
MSKLQTRKSTPKHDNLLQGAKNASDFSQLTYLLHLVTALNSNNPQSGFHEYQVRDRERKATAQAEASFHPLNVTLLDSIAAILVQQHEVVAACYTSDKVSVVVVETDPNPSIDHDIDDVLVESPPPGSQTFYPSTDRDVDVLVESPLPGSHTFYPLQLAAVSNPDFRNSSNNAKLNANQHNLQIQTIGDNLWTSVRDLNKWYCVLMLVCYLFTSREY